MDSVLWVMLRVVVIGYTLERQAGTRSWGSECQIEGCKLYPIESRGPPKGFEQRVGVIERTL